MYRRHINKFIYLYLTRYYDALRGPLLHVVRPPDDTPCVVGGQVARAVLTADTGVPRLDGGLRARAARRRAPRPVPTRGPTAGRHASTTPSGTCTHSAPGSACGKPHANSVVGI